MSYTLSLSNGTAIPGVGTTGLQDGTVDSGSTSLSLVGKNYPGYGKLLNENFVYLLENFANTKSPTSALPGQIWWDTSAKVLKVNTATAAGNPAVWKSLSSIYNADPITDAATGTVGTPKYLSYAPVVGDLWWDTANRQLKLFTGATSGANAVGNGGWLTIGPVNNTTTGQTGATPDTIVDNTNVPRVVIKFYIKDQLSAILNKENEFTPIAAIPGFTTIKPGFNLAQLDAPNPPYLYNGVATTAMNLLVGNTVVSASSFARSDTTVPSAVSISTTSTDGIKIGPVNNVIIDIDPATGVGRVRHTVSGKNLTLGVQQLTNLVPVITLNSSTGHAEVSSPLNNNDIANKFYVDTTSLARDGSNTITGTLVPANSNSVNLGSATASFNVVYGTSMSAKYADLAERFAADAEYEAGTVVELGGSAEITITGTELSENVFGVISTRAAYLMNASSGDDITHPPVALSGRVPVKVIGIIRKGDRLVSAGNGVARAGTKEEITPWNVIGRALQDKETVGLSVIEAIVKINN
jgi:hypothetical protein